MAEREKEKKAFSTWKGCASRKLLKTSEAKSPLRLPICPPVPLALRVLRAEVVRWICNG